MTTPAQFRKFADECMQSARTATSDDVRKYFLDLAKMWKTAAERIDDNVDAPPISPNQDPERPR